MKNICILLIMFLVSMFTLKCSIQNNNSEPLEKDKTITTISRSLNPFYSNDNIIKIQTGNADYVINLEMVNSDYKKKKEIDSKQITAEIKVISDYFITAENFKSGKIDILVLSFDEYLKIYDQIAVAVPSIIYVSHYLTDSVLLANDPIASVTELSGKKISALNNSPELYFLELLLRINNVVDCTIVKTASNTESSANLISGITDVSYISAIEYSSSPDLKKKTVLFTNNNFYNYFPVLVIVRENHLIKQYANIQIMIKDLLTLSNNLNETNKEKRNNYFQSKGLSDENISKIKYLRYAQYYDNLSYFSVTPDSITNFFSVYKFYVDNQSLVLYDRMNSSMISNLFDLFKNDKKKFTVNSETLKNKTRVFNVPVSYNDNQYATTIDVDKQMKILARFFYGVQNCEIQLSFKFGKNDSKDVNFWNERVRNFSGDLSKRYGISGNFIKINYNELYNIKTISENNSYDNSEIIASVNVYPSVLLP